MVVQEEVLKKEEEKSGPESEEEETTEEETDSEEEEGQRLKPVFVRSLFLDLVPVLCLLGFEFILPRSSNLVV